MSDEQAARAYAWALYPPSEGGPTEEVEDAFLAGVAHGRQQEREWAAGIVEDAIGRGECGTDELQAMADTIRKGTT